MIRVEEDRRQVQREGLIRVRDEFIDSDNPDEVLVVVRVGRRFVYTKPLGQVDDALVCEGEWVRNDVQSRVNRRREHLNNI